MISKERLEKIILELLSRVNSNVEESEYYWTILSNTFALSAFLRTIAATEKDIHYATLIRQIVIDLTNEMLENGSIRFREVKKDSSHVLPINSRQEESSTDNRNDEGQDRNSSQQSQSKETTENTT